MQKKQWPWKRRSSERSPGETESSGSMSSHSGRYSDEQEPYKASPNNSQSPEITSNLSVTSEDDVNDNIRHLTEKLSAALVNVSAKDDLVKQHSKVAEEAVAGWEKAENELTVVKKQLEDANQKNQTLQDRASHLDGALKECVRQLRLAREEQELIIYDALTEKAHEWESTKSELERQLLELRNKRRDHVDPEIFQKLEYMDRENSTLKFELVSLSEELEVRTIERDLSIQAAETASKQNLESIKKVAKLEAERRRLKSIACRPSSVSICAESLTDSHSDSGDHIYELRKSEPSWCGSCASDQIKNEKAVNKNSSTEIDLMDDFLEMERLAALPETRTNHLNEEAVDKNTLRCELEAIVSQKTNLEEKLVNIQTEKAEMEETLEKMEETLEKMEREKAEMERKLKEMEEENNKLELALFNQSEHIETSQLKLKEADIRLKEMQQEMCNANESKQLMESKLTSIEVESRAMSAKIEALEAEVEKQKATSKGVVAKYEELEDELWRTRQELELQQTASVNSQLKIKQEDLEVAAVKLSDCQKTIESLGKQLKSLATLEDFLVDTASLPNLTTGNSTLMRNSELWKLHCNETYSPKAAFDLSKVGIDSSCSTVTKYDVNPSSPAVSTNHGSCEKNRNGFSKFFSRSKNGIQLDL